VAIGDPLKTKVMVLWSLNLLLLAMNVIIAYPGLAVHELMHFVFAALINLNKINDMHTDALGRDICINDYVAFPQSNQLMIGKVAKLSNKMLIIEAVVKKRVNRYGERIETYRKYPKDSVVVDPNAGLTMYVMRNS
jgi:hypothetical protein